MALPLSKIIVFSMMNNESKNITKQKLDSTIPTMISILGIIINSQVVTPTGKKTDQGLAVWVTLKKLCAVGLNEDEVYIDCSERYLI